MGVVSDALVSESTFARSLVSSTSPSRPASMRRAWCAALLLCGLAAALSVAQGRTLAQQEQNPFVTRGGIANPAQQASPAEAEGAAAPSAVPAAAAPLPEAAAPAPSPAGAPAPAPEAAASADAAAGGPCDCTTTGLSGSTNTSRIGCAQHDLVSGSNRLTCYVNVSAAPAPCRPLPLTAAGVLLWLEQLALLQRCTALQAARII
jgi:hypothetical protein